MNRGFFLASALAGGVVPLMLFCGSLACSGSEAQSPCPEHQAATLQKAPSAGELQGFPLLLRLHFNALPAQMPGSQDLCCDGCEPEMKKDPEKYLAKIKSAKPKDRDRQ